MYVCVFFTNRAMLSRLQHAYSVVHISTDFLQETTYNGRYVTDAQQKETLGAYEVMYTLLDIEPGTPLETSIGFMSIDLRSERKAQDVYASLQGKSISISGADSRGFHLVSLVDIESPRGKTRGYSVTCTWPRKAANNGDIPLLLKAAQKVLQKAVASAKAAKDCEWEKVVALHLADHEAVQAAGHAAHQADVADLTQQLVEVRAEVKRCADLAAAAEAQRRRERATSEDTVAALRAQVAHLEKEREKEREKEAALQNKDKQQLKALTKQVARQKKQGATIPGPSPQEHARVVEELARVKAMLVKSFKKEQSLESDRKVAMACFVDLALEMEPDDDDDDDDAGEHEEKREEDILQEEKREVVASDGDGGGDGGDDDGGDDGDDDGDVGESRRDAVAEWCRTQRMEDLTFLVRTREQLRREDARALEVAKWAKALEVDLDNAHASSCALAFALLEGRLLPGDLALCVACEVAPPSPLHVQAVRDALLVGGSASSSDPPMVFRRLHGVHVDKLSIGEADAGPVLRGDVPLLWGPTKPGLYVIEIIRSKGSGQYVSAELLCRRVDEEEGLQGMFVNARSCRPLGTGSVCGLLVGGARCCCVDAKGVLSDVSCSGLRDAWDVLFYGGKAPSSTWSASAEAACVAALWEGALAHLMANVGSFLVPQPALPAMVYFLCAQLVRYDATAKRYFSSHAGVRHVEHAAVSRFLKCHLMRHYDSGASKDKDTDTHGRRDGLELSFLGRRLQKEKPQRAACLLGQLKEICAEERSSAMAIEDLRNMCKTVCVPAASGRVKKKRY